MRYSCTVLSNLLVYVTTWWSLGLNGGGDRPVGPDDEHRFQQVVVTGLAVGLLCTVVFHWGVKEPGTPAAPPGTVRPRGYAILCSPHTFQCAAAYMCTRLFVNLAQVLFNLF